jgi:hypothetical protein
MTTTRTATGAVVDFIQTARFADFPAEALTIGKRCIVDGLGVMLAGSTQDAGRILHEHVQGTDPRTASTVFGPKPFKTGSASAALVNGTAGHALDWDDTQLATSADPNAGLRAHQLGVEAGLQGRGDARAGRLQAAGGRHVARFGEHFGAGAVAFELDGELRTVGFVGAHAGGSDGGKSGDGEDGLGVHDRDLSVNGDKQHFDRCGPL